MGAIELSIDALLLDSVNPRIGSADSQRDALQKIVDDQGDKLFALAEDITTEGLSPIDRILVIREAPRSKRWIALEGNRRVAAMKILSNPHILGGIDLRSGLRKRFEDLAGGFDIADIEPVDCFEVSSREQAKHWIHLRHTGENEGRGVVGWSGVAAARFRGEDPALQALELVKNYGDLPADDIARLGHSFPITTLDRLLSTAEVRKAIGVEIAENKLATRLPAREVIKPLKRMVLDLAHRTINVSRLKNKQQQIEYVNAFASGDKPDFGKTGALRAIEGLRTADFGTPSVKTHKRKPASLERTTVAPRRLTLNVTDPKSAAILKELQQLKVDDTPNAGAVLLRVFLELSTDAFLDRNNIPLRISPPGGKTVDKTLQRKIGEAIDHLVMNEGANRKDFISVSRGINVKDSPLWIDLLHAYVHSRFVTPRSRELIAAWDDAQPFFQRIWR